jgi:hypothetical protein
VRITEILTDGKSPSVEATGKRFIAPPKAAKPAETKPSETKPAEGEAAAASA